MLNADKYNRLFKSRIFGQKDSDVHFYTYYIYIFFEYMSDYWTSH